MTFDTVERSNFQGRPITLYEFRLGTTRWRYSSTDRDITLAGDVYVATPISDGGATQSGEPRNEDFVVTLPIDAAVVVAYKTAPPSEPIYLYVREHHFGETDAAITWVGTVSTIRPGKLASAEIVANLFTASFNTNGLRLSWSRNCPHALYDHNCKVDKTLHAVPGTVTWLDGLNVKGVAFDALADGHFSGGFIEWPSPLGFTERRSIRKHVGENLELIDSTRGLTVGLAIIAYPGCKRTVEECDVKFNNFPNYGGFPHIPGKSPFDGTGVF